jgi:replication factor C small subunit
MILVEKYRPKSLDDIVGQDDIVATFKELVAKEKAEPGTFPHILMLGEPGTGKTSIAMATARDMFGDEWKSYFIELNASDERGIDVVRTKIKSLSRHKGRRIVFLDEADNLTNDAQGALRRIMEETPNTIFFMSGNRGDLLIDAIKSRCCGFRFKRLSDEVVMQKLLEVCKLEGVKLKLEDKEGFMAIVELSKGDLRRAINTLEGCITAGKEFNAKAIIEQQKPNLAAIAVKTASQGDFEKAKDMIQDAIIAEGYEASRIIEFIYEGLNDMTFSANPERNREIKIRLYAKLGEVEHNCKSGNPLVQLVAFIAFAWIAPHMAGVSGL